jgi:hypothetical protein
VLKRLGAKECVKAVPFTKAQFLELHAKLASVGPDNTGFQDEQRIFTIREIEEQGQLHSDPHRLIPSDAESAFRQVHDTPVPDQDVMSIDP